MEAAARDIREKRVVGFSRVGAKYFVTLYRFGGSSHGF